MAEKEELIGECTNINECSFYLCLSGNCDELHDDNGNTVYECNQRNDCYYKQLQYLKQDNEKLRKDAELDETQLKSYFIFEEEVNKKIKRLEKENEGLKELLIQMGCPTIATAKRTVLNLKQEVERKSNVILKYIVKYDALISSIERVIDFSVEEIMDLRGIDLSNISNENLATLKNVSNAFKLGKIRKILEMARKNENE